jgi:hypothetical protein
MINQKYRRPASNFKALGNFASPAAVPPASPIQVVFFDCLLGT